MNPMVCENHPDKLWPEQCSCGAGMPSLEYDYSEVGRQATVKAGGYDALVARGWHHIDNANRDGQTGKIVFRFGRFTRDEHLAVDFGDGIVGLPPQYVEIH
jgi:hypothetical protein